MLTWTTKKQTKAGWYWYRDDAVTCIHEVRDDLTVGNADVRDPLYRYSGEWYGPLEVPL